MAHTILSVDASRELLQYMEWADAKVWAAVLASDAAREDASIREYLLHIHMVQQLFLALWRHDPPEPIATRKATDFPQLTDLYSWIQPYYSKVRAFLDTADESVFSQIVQMPWLGEYEKQMGMTFARPTLAETMFQIVNHTTHHRAQVLVRLRAAGAQPPLVDFIAWIWFGKPAPEWVASAS